MIYTTCMKLGLLTNKSTKSVQKQISVQKQKKSVQKLICKKSIIAHKKAHKSNYSVVKEKKKHLLMAQTRRLASSGPVFIVAAFHLAYFIDYYLHM